MYDNVYTRPTEEWVSLHWTATWSAACFASWPAVTVNSWDVPYDNDSDDAADVNVCI